MTAEDDERSVRQTLAIDNLLSGNHPHNSGELCPQVLTLLVASPAIQDSRSLLQDVYTIATIVHGLHRPRTRFAASIRLRREKSICYMT